MKRGHASKQSWLVVLAWIAPIAWFKLRGVMPDLAISVLCILGSLHVAGWLRSILSRRHEREADLDGVQISGDAEAFISALRKLDELNAMPGELNKFEQAISTHPATRKRIEAITQAAQGLSQPPSTSSAAVPAANPTYTLPQAVEAATQGDPPVFDSTIKSKIVNQFTMAYMFAVGLPPLLIAVVANWFESGPAMVVFWIAGVAAYLALLVWMTNCVGRGLLSNLRAKVETRLSRIYGPTPADTIFVGLSPGADVRIYEGCYSWDVGFVSLRGAQLCYEGEQARFTLTRSQIRQVRLGAGAPRWSKSQRVYIDWDDPASARQGSFALSCAGQKSFSQDAKACAVLAEQIQEWQQNGAGNHGEVACSADLPMFGEVTSHCPRTQMSFAKYLSTLLLALAIPIGLGAGAGMHRENLLNTGLTFLCIVLGHTFVCVPIWRLKRAGRLDAEGRGELAAVKNV